MVWRINKTYKSGSDSYDATPYADEDAALAVIKREWDRGLIERANIEDHDGKKVGWSEIKRRLGLA
jgi:hypothetical protein